MPACSAGTTDERLIAYWAGDLPPDETAILEEHWFGCEDCRARLAELASLQQGVKDLARQGRLAGVVSRAVVNRLQRDGLRVRQYSLLPGESVACAVFPGDDLIITSLRADLSAESAVAVSVDGPEPLAHEFEDVPIIPSDGEVLFALPAHVARALPSTRLAFTVRSTTPDHRVLGEYVLEHSRQPLEPS